jgi:hypothetical protein
MILTPPTVRAWNRSASRDSVECTRAPPPPRPAQAFTALSLILFAATAILWTRCFLTPGPNRWNTAHYDGISLSRSDVSSARAVNREVRLWSYSHGLHLIWDTNVYNAALPPDPVTLREAHEWRRDGPLSGGLHDTEPRTLGWRLRRILGHGGPISQDALRVSVPYWFLLPTLAALPATWVVRRSSHRRRKRLGHCATCGYDLRATPERCPECGKVPAR